MSFILDALKKSETERQRKDTPGIASIPQGGRQQGPARWPWVVAGLLVINLGVLAAIMLKPDITATTAEPAVDRSGPTDAPAPPPSSADRVTTQSLPEPATTPAAQPATQTGSAARQSPAPVQPAVREAGPAPAAALPTITDGLPSLRELQAAGQIQLPEMHLDIHVYSGQPADRFVFVNMSKYKEGATLREGPKIVEIAPDGVVLDYYGTRFLLPRE